jgi:hypothetical protein
MQLLSSGGGRRLACVALASLIGIAANGAAAQPPARATIAFVSPADGQTLSGKVTWQVNVGDVTPTSVTFLIDGAAKWTEYYAPYSFNGDNGQLDTTTLSNGRHTLSVNVAAPKGPDQSSATTVTTSNGTPSNTASPTISGTPVVAQTLSSSTGSWQPAATGYSYQWQRCGTSCSAISGAAGTSYIVAQADVGTTLRVSVIASNSAGTTMATSAPTAPVAAASSQTTSAASTSTSTSTSEATTTTTTATAFSGSPTTPSTSTTTTSPSFSSDRHVYCYGDTSYGTGGWAWDGTSLGWMRQAPSTIISQRVVYDGVPLVNGCSTIKAEVLPSDPVLWGGQRAQFYAGDSMLASHGSQPSLGASRGEYHWYSFAFSTNSAYKPQAALPNPNWNTVFAWHDTQAADGSSHPQANIGVNIATAQPNGSGGWSFFSQPRIAIEVYGGDPSDPNWWSHGHRWYTVPFVAGQKYVVAMGVRWGDSGNGSIEVWINGQQVVPQTAVSDLWWGAGVYPIFENYRQANQNDGGYVTWTNDVYHGGFIKGASLADVAMQ